MIKKNTITLIITFVTILALGAGFWVWKNWKNANDIKQAQNLEQQKSEQQKKEQNIFTQSDFDRIFELNKKEIGTKIYYSEDLGVGFTYISHPNSNYPIDIKEHDNKISVLNQTIEVFIKDPGMSLEEAIQDRFLQGYDSKDCFVKTYEIDKQKPSSYVSSGISFPLTDNPNAFWAQNSYKCPRDYSETNGARYFIMNRDVPKKFLFISIGQSSVASDGTPRTAEGGFNWDHSIRILK